MVLLADATWLDAAAAVEVSWARAAPAVPSGINRPRPTAATHRAAVRRREGPRSARLAATPTPGPVVVMWFMMFSLKFSTSSGPAPDNENSANHRLSRP